MEILLNDFKRQWQAIEGEVLAAVRRVGASGHYILGKEVLVLEARLAEFAGFAHAIGVANGQDAIEISLRSLGIGPGHLVLTTPLSAFASTLAILKVGATPLFCDTDSYGLLDLTICEEILNRREDIRCLLPVNLYGHATNQSRLDQIRKEFSLLLVQDCAQSIGARWEGAIAGARSDMAAMSFYPTKNLGALGDGGLVLTNSNAYADRARSLRHYGQTAIYVHDYLGLNSRLDELHAAILADAMMPNLLRWEARRLEIAQRYLSEITNPKLCLPGAPVSSESVWHLFPILVEAADREQFRQFLANRGIQTGLHYPKLITEQKALLQNGNFEIVGTLQNAKRYAAEEVSLPVHPFLTDDEVAAVVDSCNSWEGL